MKKRFEFLTLLLGVVTGANTALMLINKNLYSYISGAVIILAFIITAILDYRNN